MQLQQAVRHEVTRHNVGAESDFSFTINALTFRTLSSTMYEDKIGAIVREVSCNAMDAHAAIGESDKPITIHLPSELEPYFSVIDRGIGMSDSDVRSTFASYFNSTKGKTNTQIGAFGLGSKSPFAYTDAFTVTSIKDGMKRTYSAYVNGETGIPALAIMGEEETDDHNGTEIMVPVVHTGDFQKFKNAVASQLRFFKVKPKIVNGNVIFDEISTINVADGVDLYSDNNNVSRAIWIVQGGVGYPLNTDVISQHLSEDNNKFLAFLDNMGAVLTFPIGTIETTPSREGLSYSAFTNTNIDARLTASRDVVARNMVTKVEAITSQWDRAKFLNDNGMYTDILSNNDAKVFDSLIPDMITTSYHNKLTSWGFAFDVNVCRMTKWSSRYGRKRQIIAQTEDNVEAVKAGEVCIMIRDTADKAISRLKEYIDTQREAVYLLTPADLVTGPVPLSDVTDRLDSLGVPYKLLSDQPIPVRNPAIRSNKTYDKPSCYLRTASEYGYNVKDWDRVIPKIKELTDGGYYVVIPEGSRFEVTHLPDALDFIWKMDSNNNLDKQVFAIRERELKRIANNEEWIPLQTIAEEFVELHGKSEPVIRALAAKQFNPGRRGFHNVVEQVSKYLTDAGGDIPEEFVSLVRFNLLLDRLRAPLATTEQYAVNIAAKVSAETVQRHHERLETMFKNLVAKIVDRYPLLQYAPTEHTYDRDSGEYVYKVKPEVMSHLAQYLAFFGAVE